MGAFPILRGRSTTPAPPVSDYTLRSYDSQQIDMATILASLDDSDRVTISVSGEVSCLVMPYWHKLMGDGDSASLAKATLCRMLCAWTQNATEGSAIGTWTLSGPGGFSAELVFDVDDTPPTEWDYGQKTLAQYGGYPIAQYLPGTASDWTIQSQSTSGAFVINTTTNCVAFAGTAGSTTRTVGTPTLGDAAYTVTLQNTVLGQTHTISFNIIAYRYDMAATNEQWRKSRESSGQHFGDEFVANDTPDGTYQNPTRDSSDSLAYIVAPTQRVGGPAAPTGPYVGDSWTYQAQRNAGWITMRARNPFRVRPNLFQIRPPNGTGTCITRFLHIDGRTNSTPPTEQALALAANSTNTCNWLMADYCINNFIGWSGNDSVFISEVSILNSWFGQEADTPSVESNGYTIGGLNSQDFGNVVVNTTNDAIYGFNANSVPGSGKSGCGFNFVINKKIAESGIHGDFKQYYSGIKNRTQLAAISDTYKSYDMAYEIGNVFVRGIGSSTVAGAQLDGQGTWAGDFSVIIGEYTASIRTGGMVEVGVMVGGAGRKWAGVGTSFRNCAFIWPQYVTDPDPGVGTGSPTIRLMSSGAKVGIANCVTAQAISLATIDVAPPTPVTSNNVNINSQNSSAYFVSPNTGLSTAQWLEEVIDALTPLPGGPLTVAGGASQVVGPIGSGLIDHILQTYDTVLLDPVSGQPTTAATWDAAAVATGTPTVGNTLTAPNFSWSESVTVNLRAWLRNGAIIASSNSTTYLLAAGDAGTENRYAEWITDTQGNKIVAVSVARTIT